MAAEERKARRTRRAARNNSTNNKRRRQKSLCDQCPYAAYMDGLRVVCGVCVRSIERSSAEGHRTQVEVAIVGGSR